jgi:hypothetical protein
MIFTSKLLIAEATRTIVMNVGIAPPKVVNTQSAMMPSPMVTFPLKDTGNRKRRIPIKEGMANFRTWEVE